jgi:hypothetical protein
MKYINKFIGIFIITMCFSLGAFAQEIPYKDGTVWSITFIKTKPGMADDYLRSLASTWRKVNEQAKKEGLILSYKILSGDAVNRDDWDLLLLTEHKNMASLDGLDEKFQAIATKIEGSEDQQKAIMTSRVEMREILGSKLVREIFLK